MSNPTVPLGIQSTAGAVPVRNEKGLSGHKSYEYKL